MPTLGLITSSLDLWSSDALVVAFEKAGWHIQQLDLSTMGVCSAPVLVRQHNLDKPRTIKERHFPLQILDKDHAVGLCDYLVPRIAGSIASRVAPILSAMERAIPTTASTKGILASHDKWETYARLLEHSELHQYIPYTLLITDDRMLSHFRKDIPIPCIIKPCTGTQGDAVIKCSDLNDMMETAHHFASSGVPFIIQELVPGGEVDHRLFVIGGRVAAAMKRTAKPGEYRANIHQGGTGEKVPRIPTEWHRLAKTVSIAMDLDVFGLDIIVGDGKISILEVNSTPGLEGISNATGVDVARRIVSHVGKMHRNKMGRRRRTKVPQ